MSNIKDTSKIDKIVSDNTLNKNICTGSKISFDARNYWVMALSFALIVIGFVLMSGGGSTMEHYEPDVFSDVRVIYAPALCFVGYVLMIVGIVLRRRG